MKSMTGFGAAEGKVGKGSLFVEIRSVNHRYCDVLLKIPPKFNVLDPRIRKSIQSRIARGKIDLFMKEKREIEPLPTVRPNLELAAAYHRALQQLAKSLKGAAPHLLDVVDLRDLVIIQEPKVRYERFWRELGPILQRALTQLDRMRRTEGAHLKQDQMKRLKHLETVAIHIRKLAGRFTVRNNRTNNNEEELTARSSVIDIHEELTRLQSHIQQYRRYAAQAGPVGRQLDFLLQEMNREVNTIGSKGNDATISQLVVEAKSELEKLREQVQNVE